MYKRQGHLLNVDALYLFNKYCLISSAFSKLHLISNSAGLLGGGSLFRHPHSARLPLATDSFSIDVAEAENSFDGVAPT